MAKRKKSFDDFLVRILKEGGLSYYQIRTLAAEKGWDRVYVSKRMPKLVDNGLILRNIYGPAAPGSRHEYIYFLRENDRPEIDNLLSNRILFSLAHIDEITHEKLSVALRVAEDRIESQVVTLSELNTLKKKGWVTNHRNSWSITQDGRDIVDMFYPEEGDDEEDAAPAEVTNDARQEENAEALEQISSRLEEGALLPLEQLSELTRNLGEESSALQELSDTLDATMDMRATLGLHNSTQAVSQLKGSLEGTTKVRMWAESLSEEITNTFAILQTLDLAKLNEVLDEVESKFQEMEGKVSRIQALNESINAFVSLRKNGSNGVALPLNGDVTSSPH